MVKFCIYHAWFGGEKLKTQTVCKSRQYRKLEIYSNQGMLLQVVTLTLGILAGYLEKYLEGIL